MKTCKCLFTILLSLIMLGILCPAVLYSSGISDSVIPIEEENGGGDEGDDPNVVFAPIPIRCELSSSNLELRFTFYSDLGEITVSLYNTSTGFFESQVVNTQLGLVNVPISGEAGNYIMLISTAAGCRYTAYFDIL